MDLGVVDPTVQLHDAVEIFAEHGGDVTGTLAVLERAPQPPSAVSKSFIVNEDAHLIEAVIELDGLRADGGLHLVMVYAGALISAKIWIFGSPPENPTPINQLTTSQEHHAMR